MKKIINKIGRALQVILLTPVKLPSKTLDILKYLALAVGIIESVIDGKEKTEGKEIEKEGTDKEGGGKDEDQ